ncbi:MAG TPA: leucyl aminopeptidase family protein [Gammaproteobacteria bacterium]|nr:leucyl aminopeptidase family protein [Gammaproteobacteria bacterium]
MAQALPQPLKIRLEQQPEAAGTAQMDALDAVIILLPAASGQKPWPAFPHAERLRQKLPAGKAGREAGCIVQTDLPNKALTTAVLGFIADGASCFEWLTLARKLVARALERNPARVGVMLPGMKPAQQHAAADALLAALHAASFAAPQFKREPAAARRLKSIRLFGVAQKFDAAHTLAAAEGNALARWLTLQPANHLTPARYRAHLAALARREGWRFEFLDRRKLQALKAGAFLAVAQGSDAGDAGIAHLVYKPVKPAKNARPVALVGKGICYDTGGVNLKSAKGMFGMHGDMQGSAVALGTLLALTRLKVPFQVDCWLALSRNDIGPRAYTQNDVITASNGVNIEIVHTDAEGRMVLSDTLAIASRARPGLLLDFATLTGSCITALGTRYSGAFCNHETLTALVIAAGRASGERMWPFPVDSDYDEALESTIADVKQCLIEGEADHILAARFLSRFVPGDIPWVHIDLAAGEHKGGLAHVPTETTGFGVRFSLNLLLEQKLPAP